MMCLWLSALTLKHYQANPGAPQYDDSSKLMQRNRVMPSMCCCSRSELLYCIGGLWGNLTYNDSGLSDCLSEKQNKDKDPGIPKATVDHVGCIPGSQTP